MTLKVKKKLLKAILIRTYGHIMPAIRILDKEYGINISRTAIYKRLKNNPSLSDAVDESLENLKDIAEHEFARNITKGNLSAITYFLDRKAKDRGYILRTEQEHRGELNIKQQKPYDFSNWSDKDLETYVSLKRKYEHKNSGCELQSHFFCKV